MIDIQNLEELREHLPASMLEIVDVIGWSAALELMKHLGGASLNIPRGMQDSKRLSILHDAIGEAASKELMAVFGGAQLYIPRCEAALRALRNLELKADVAWLVSQGESRNFAIQQIAPCYGITERQAYRLFKNDKSQQKTLF